MSSFCVYPGNREPYTDPLQCVGCLFEMLTVCTDALFCHLSKKYFRFRSGVATIGRNMSEDRHDIALLRAFTRQADQPAFAAVVRRHMDLVYATAMRQLTDQAAAEEVMQDVFAALARQAWQFSPGDSVPAWLYRVTLLKSKQWLRGEIRRRRREQTAAQLGTTMKNADEQAAFGALIPLMDEGLLSLREKDRAALLLRFYERGSLAEVGAKMGVSEDAARKRVATALEQLARFFHRRGFKTVTAASAAAALQSTASGPPALVAAAVLQGAMQCAPPVGLGLALLSRLVGLTPPQTVVLCLALVAGPIVWQWNTFRTIRQQTAATRLQADTLRAEYDRLMTEADPLEHEADRLGQRLKLQTLSRNESMARAVEDAKNRFRGLLTEADDAWPEDLPFVRIPKSALRDIRVPLPITPPGVIRPALRDLLSVTPAERGAVEQALATYYQDVGRRMEAGIYETNSPGQGPLPENWLARAEFVVPPLGTDIKLPLKQLAEDLSAALGKDRWALLESQLDGSSEARRVLYLDTANQSQQMTLWIQSPGQSPPTIGFKWNGPGFGNSASGGVLLRDFLPQSGLDREARVKNMCGALLPDALAAHMTRWLTGQAMTRLSSPRP